MRAAARGDAAPLRSEYRRPLFRTIVAALVIGLSIPYGSPGAIAAPTSGDDVGAPSAIELTDVFQQSRSFWSSVLPDAQELVPARHPDTVVTGSLSAAELGAAFGQATAEWRASGANTTGISVATRDLPGETLGVTEGRQIVIDQDAAGWGWSKMSLVTVIRHEVGHALGYGHAAAGLMGATLEPGAEFSVPAAPALLPRVVADGAPMDLTAPALLPMDDEESDSSDSEDKPKAEAKEESKAEAQAEPKEEPKAEPKEEPKAEPKEEPAAEPKEEPKAEPKDEATEEPKADPEPEAKDDPAQEATSSTEGTQPSGASESAGSSDSSGSNGAIGSDNATTTGTPGLESGSALANSSNSSNTASQASSTAATPTGTTSASTGVSVSSSSLDFGRVRPSTGGTQTVTLTNNSSTTVQLDGTVLDDPAGAFVIGALPAALAPGESVTVTISVVPGRTGTRTGTLSFGDGLTVDLSAQLSRWSLDGDTATASVTNDEFFSHQLLLNTSLVSLVSLADLFDSDDAPDASRLVIAGGSLSDRIVLVGLAGLRTIQLLGGGGLDTLVGPAGDQIWQITGAGSGAVAGVAFTGFENLTGAAGNSDRFILGRDARISGTIDGGPGGYDTLVLDASGGSVKAVGSDPHSGVIEVNGVRYVYAGLEPITITGAADLTVSGTAGDDTATLTASATSPGWFTFSGATFETVEFALPTGSLLIDALAGRDTITVANTYGALDFGAIGVTLKAETILVDGATLTTSGALALLAEATDNGATLISGVDYVTTASPSAIVRLLNGARVSGGSVTIKAQATSANTPPSEQLLILVVDAEALVEISGGSEVIATGGDATLASLVQVTASNPAVGNALFGSSSTNAAAAWAHVTTSSQVLVEAGSRVTATGAVLLQAATVNQVASSGDAGAASNGAGIGVAVVNETTRARSRGATLAGSSVTVEVTSTSTATTSAKASSNGATSNQAGSTPNEATSTPTNTGGNANTSDGAVAVAATIAFAFLSSLAEALLDGGAVTTAGALGILARATRAVSAVADSSNVGSSGTGVGVAVAVTLLMTDTIARLLGSVTLTAGSVAITAENPGTDTVTATALSGQGTAAPGVAGALAVAVTDSDTEAGLGSTAAATVNGSSLAVTADSNLTTTVSAAPVPGANPSTDGNLGIGASVALNIVDATTLAALADGSALTGAHNLSLSATGAGTHTTTATGGAAGGIAITPVVAISISTDTVRAYLGTGSVLTLTGSLDLAATQTVGVTTSAQGDAIGSNAAIGAALALAVVTHRVESVVARNVTTPGLVHLAATGATTSTTTAKASANGAPGTGGGSPTPDAQAGEQRTLGDSVAAGNGAAGSTGSPSTPPSQTSNGTVAVAAAISINVLTTNALATINAGVVVNAGGVSLATAANSDALTSADGSATIERGPPATIGAAIAITVANVTNSSTVAGTVNAPTTLKSLVNTTPDAGHSFTATATSGAGGGDVSVAGSFALAVVTILTRASVTGTVAALDAQAASSATTTVEALPGEKTGSGKKAGIGASIALAIVNDTTVATLAGVVSGGALVLSATQAHAVTTTARTGAKGGVAVAAAVALAITNLDVAVTIAAGAAAGLASVNATATQTVSSKVIAAGDSSDATDAAVGAAIALAIADHTATARTYRSLAVTGAAAFAAASDSTVSASATASAAGAPQKEGSTPADGVDQQVAAERSNADSLAPSGGGSGSESTPSAATSGGTVSVAAAIAITVSRVTIDASLAGVTLSAGAVTLSATGRTTATATASGAAVSTGSGTSVGAAVALTVASLIKNAAVASGVSLTVGSLALTAGGRARTRSGRRPRRAPAVASWGWPGPWRSWS